MFCPQCGQQQIAESVKFCSRCGLPLETVTAVVSSGGALPMHYLQGKSRELSPRSRGIRQGALMMLSTMLVVPVIAVLSVTLNTVPEIVIPVAALVCFVGGLLRILYALLMEAAYPSAPAPQLSPLNVPAAQLEPHPPAARPSLNSPGWQSRPQTAEIFVPPSVTENTTRLLNKDEPKED